MIEYYHRLTRKEMEQVDKEKTVVLIPLGALEQHGSQAPLGTDYMIASTMPSYIEREIKGDMDLLFFPAMPIGLSTEHMKFCGSITYKPDTYYRMLYEIGKSLATHGFKKLVFLICHGGNEPVAKLLSRELRADFGIYPFVVHSGAFDHPDVQATISFPESFDFHGGEMETSMVMAIDPESVKLELSEPGHLKNASLQMGLSWLGEDWITDEGKPIGIGGDPQGATAEKGEIILRVSAQRIARQLAKIYAWNEEVGV